MSEGFAKFLALRWLGVDLEVIVTAVVAAVSVAGLVGWINALSKVRVLQAIVSCIILAPGATAFTINQWQLGPWWGFVIGALVGVAGLPFLVHAARKAPDVAEVGVDGLISRITGAVLGRLPGQKPPAAPGQDPGKPGG